LKFNLFRSELIPEDKIIYIYDLIKNIVAPGNRAFVSPLVQKAVDKILDLDLPKNWRTDKHFIKGLNDSFRRKQNRWCC